MEYYLCKHCKSITNSAWNGPCEDSVDGNHQWVSGEKADNYVHRLWQDPVGAGSTSRTHSAP